MSREIHFERIAVGLCWLFISLLMASQFERLGYDMVVSAVAGVLFAPAMIIAAYVMGAVGMWTLKIIHSTGYWK